jgi:hypothetical protein
MSELRQMVKTKKHVVCGNQDIKDIAYHYYLFDMGVNNASKVYSLVARTHEHGDLPGSGHPETNKPTSYG